jgi:hypothetical protein
MTIYLDDNTTDPLLVTGADLAGVRDANANDVSAGSHRARRDMGCS